MAQDWLERDDLSVFVVAGAPKGFNKALKELLGNGSGEEGESLRVKDDLADWVLARVQSDYRKSAWQTPASKALWRAFRALAAARYHVRADPERAEELREIREQVERHWAEVKPAPPVEDEVEEAESGKGDSGG